MNERQRIVNIPYEGYSATPSDHDCPDGQLATAMNVVLEDGSLKPVLPAGRVSCPELYDGNTFIGNLEVIFCHKNNSWVHYIGYYQDKENDKLYYGWLDFNSEDGWENTSDDEWTGFYEYPDGYTGERNIISLDGETHKSITAVGNTLIISTDKNIHYFLFKQDTYKISESITGEFSGYRYLGTSVPAVKLEFALDGELLGKRYDVGLTMGGDATGEEQWEIVATADVTTATSASDATYHEFTVSSPLTNGSHYRFYSKNDLPKTYNTATCILQGYDETNSKWTKIFNVQVTFSSSSKYAVDFTLPEGYSTTKFRIRFWNLEINQTISLVFEIGITGSTTTKNIKNTEDNFTALMSVVNTFRSVAASSGKHIHPFFVRYATKLYDGNYLCVSPPILMRPNTDYVPVLDYSTGNSDDDSSGSVYAYGFAANLMVRAIQSIPEVWSEIVVGADIFISQPIYPYEQGKAFSKYETLYKYIRLQNADTNPGQLGYGYLRAKFGNTSLSNDTCERVSLRKSLEDYVFNGAVSEIVRVAPYEKQDIMDDLKTTSSFYRIKSYSVNELNAFNYTIDKDAEDPFSSTFSLIETDRDTLGSLVALPTLEDEPIGNRVLTQGGSYAYNKRLHLFNVSYTLPEPYPMRLCNGYYRFADVGTIAKAEADAYVVIKTEYGEKVVHHAITVAEEGIGRKGTNYLAWYFYPDNRAKTLYIVKKNGTAEKYSLTTHDTLNGAFWCAENMDGSPSKSSDAFTGLTVNNEIAVTTSIYVSEVNNPFAFKSSNVVTVGATKIISLASAAKAMSTGQFGQFPLYCFTDNGVWALELTATGTYKSTQSITRDVCISAESITQMDGSVLFATARGIMDVSGSTSVCISDNLDADDMFVPTNLPHVEALLKYVNQGSSVAVSKESISFVSFIIFCSGSRIVYDYVQQRIIVYNPSYDYAYVYSIKGKSWGMMQSNIASSFNSYPEALAMDRDGYLIDFNATTNITLDDDGKATTKTESITGANGLVVTRPLKLGATDIYKTVDTVAQRGQFETGHVQCVLYASNDLKNWKAIWSSANEYMRGMSGTPYKYFRVGLICKLDADESISGMTVRFEPKLLNRPR